MQNCKQMTLYVTDTCMCTSFLGKSGNTNNTPQVVVHSMPCRWSCSDWYITLAFCLVQANPCHHSIATSDNAMEAYPTSNHSRCVRRCRLDGIIPETLSGMPLQHVMLMYNILAIPRWIQRQFIRMWSYRTSNKLTYWSMSTIIFETWRVAVRFERRSQLICVAAGS